MDKDKAPTRARRARSAWFGLSGRLLLLTILFVMVAEVLIFVPSIANYRLTWLADRLAAARTAALVLEAAPDGMIADPLRHQLLDSVGAYAVAMRIADTRRLLAFPEAMPQVDAHVDTRDVPATTAIVDAFEALITPANRVLRVVGPAPGGGDFVEIVIDERPLRVAMLLYSRNILVLSLAISGITAMLVYFALVGLIVRPMRRMARSIMAFRNRPEDASRVIATSQRSDEIGLVERELATMQRELQGTLQSKTRLAALGLAVSKISHDLRNLLASAQLVSDRLTALQIPEVQRFAPNLIRVLDRAIDLAESTLSYGRAQEAPPQRRMVALAPLAEEVRESVGFGSDPAIGWINTIDRDLEIDADPDQLFRVLMNLVRNSLQALEARAPNDPTRDQVRLAARRAGSVVVMEVSDTGPGVPAKAREHLFEAFQGSTRRGGSGLGLAIAAELVRAHGGEIMLVDGTIGATFRIEIPDRAVDLAEQRIARQRA